MDLNASINKLFNEADLAGKTDEEIEVLTDTLYTLDGGATVKV
jgi:hypothetical protein